MRISGFSNASTQPVWTAPIEILAPWITRLKNVLGHVENVLASGRAIRSAKQSCNLEHPATIDYPGANPGSKSCNTASRSSLRVVREFDSAVSPDCAGRMVISGRMADVCAELDRMALRGTNVH